MNDNEPISDSPSNSDVELRSIIQSLDNLVSREGAWVLLHQYGGGPDEGEMKGNLNGYRRLGIELLKSTLDADRNQGLNVDIAYVVSESSTINFDSFELTDAPLESAGKRHWSNEAFGLGCMFLSLVTLGLIVIGIGTVVRWLFGS